jgi:hypothetical protein
MNNYIKSEDAVIEVERFGGYLDDDMLYRIKLALSRLPSADVVEVVRCENCMYKHVNKNNGQLTCNHRMLGEVRPNDYCSLGAKEDDE